MVQSREQSQSHAIKVLLVEDDPNDAFLLQRTLTKTGPTRFEVKCVERLDSALQCLREGQFDAVLLDLSLPDSTGLDTLDAVHSQNPDVPVVVLSGNDDENTAIGVLQRGAHDYLVKGKASGDSVARSIRYALERHRAEQKVIESEQRYRTLLESITQRIFFKDRDSVFVSVNAQFAQDAGMSANELVGKTDYDLHPKELAEKYRADDLRVMSTRLAETLEEMNVVGGRERFVEVVKAPVISDHGEVMGVLGMFTDITERKRVEEALRKSEVKFRSVAQSATDAIVSADKGGNISFWNKGAQRIFGYTEKEVLGKPLTILMPQRYRQAHQEGMERISSTGETRIIGHTLELHGLRKDGDEFPLELSLSTWETSEGPFYGGIIRDVTERKRVEEEIKTLNRGLESRVAKRTVQLAAINRALEGEIAERKRAENELRKSRDQLDVILQGIANGVTVINATGELMFANDAAAKVMGFPSVQALLETPGRDIMGRFEILDESRRPLPLDNLPGRAALRGEESPEMLLCWRVKATGDERWSIVKATPIFDEQGRVQSAISMFLDITERKLIEESVHVRAQQQALVAEFGQRALVGTDLATLMYEACVLLAQTLNADLTKVLELLPGGNALLLRSGVGWKEGFVGQALVSTGPESQAGYILRVNEPVIVEDLRSETRFRGTQVLHDHDVVSGMSVIIPGKNKPFGILSVHTQSKRLFTKDDLHFLQAIANVLAMAIERKQAEEEIMLLNRDLQSANKDLEAFSYSVSHDLHAPLRAIAGFADALAEEYTPVIDTQGQHYLSRIRINAERGGELIDDLLSFSRTGRKQIEKTNIDMEELARTIFEELQFNAPDHAPQLSVKTLPPAHGDRTLIREVVLNLLSNAVKFTKGKEPALIEIGGRTEDNETIYYVKDNGAGFDMRFAGKLFGVFQRLHSLEEFEGTGVGLAIVQRIVHRHGGRVWAEGKVGEGAIFYFALPK